MFTSFFIHRPIFAAVLSIIVTLAGGVALATLPVALYPEITPPTVEVSAVYPGANARTVADTVAAPIEQQVNGVEDMLYMSSRSTNDGSYALTVTFKPGTDLNIAQVLVQNRVNLAQPVLPDLVKRRGVTVKKKSATVLMIVNLISSDGSRSNLDLSNYATIEIRDELGRLPGVAGVGYLGQRKRCRFPAALHGMSLGEEGDERAAVAVVQDHIGLDEVLARIGAARAGSMAFDALGHPYRSAAIGGVGVDHMAVELSQ